MRVNAALQRGEQRGLTVVAPANDHRNTRNNRHTGHFTGMGQLHAFTQIFRAGESNGVTQRQIGNTRPAHQYCAVVNKTNPAALPNHVLKGEIILIRFHMFT